MILLVPKTKLQLLGLSIDSFLRRQGYALIHDRREDVYSYSRRLTRDFYPRFHVYTEERADGYLIKLHLDQKKASYQGVSRHSGEYEGETVQAEIDRISRTLPSEMGALKNQEISDIIPTRNLPEKKPDKPKKPGFFSRLLGK